jgi:hypothetical protein
MGSKIAPLLTQVLNEECGPTPAGRALAREIRALLAVARAAKRMQARGIPSWPEAQALERALARLARSTERRGRSQRSAPGGGR